MNAILTVVEGHILFAVIQVLDMTSLDDEPPSVLIFSCSGPYLRSKVMLLALQQVIDTHVDLSFSVNEEVEEDSFALDSVYEYACETLSLGLLLMEFLDAT